MTRAEAARLVSVGAARWDGDTLVYARPPRPLSCDLDRFGLACDGIANVVAYGLVGRVRYRCDGCAWCMTPCATVRFMDKPDDEPEPPTVRRRAPGGRLDVEEDDTEDQRDDRKDDKERRRG